MKRLIILLLTMTFLIGEDMLMVSLGHSPLPLSIKLLIAAIIAVLIHLMYTRWV